jgi:hypothetical protein
MNTTNRMILAGLLLGAGLPALANDCQYAQLTGKEFIFREQPAGTGQAYAYRDYRRQPKILEPGLAYKALVGKHGKILEKALDSDTVAWFKITLQDCRVLYVRAGLGGGYELKPGYRLNVDQLETTGAIVYVNTVNRARQLIGQPVWINANGGASDDRRHGLWNQGLREDKTGSRVPVSHLAAVRVKDIQLSTVPDGRDQEPLYLRVDLDGGRIGLLPYRHDFLFERNPIETGWPKEVVEKIRRREVSTGMTKAQVLAAWGPPDSRQTAKSGQKVMESWKYGSGGYQQAEFTDGVMRGYHRVVLKDTAKKK